MKKKACCICLLLLLPCLLVGCCFENSSLFWTEVAEYDGFHIGVNNTADCCFVGVYEASAYADRYEITVPDSYNGMPITRVGGYIGSGAPSPFFISLSNLYMNAPQGSEYSGVYAGNIEEFNISEPYTVVDVVFTLNIGKNIEKIEYVDMELNFPHINEDGSVTFYRAVVFIQCSEENQHFYSLDGKLYDKGSDVLITQFLYADDM
jgi:hypothetical protein